jgi:hypothetical protein|nr:hypothetical protein [Kofleriaceae bacterium]
MRAVAAIALVFAACGGGGGGGSNPDAHRGDAGSGGSAGDAALVDAAPARPLLASGGVQVLVTGPAIGLQITPADLGSDDDVLEIHQEFYGVPWDQFLAHQAPPAAWVAIMDGIAANARATGKPVFLSVSMLNGGRDTLAAKTAVDGSGNVSATDDWAAHCYDFGSASDAAAIQQAYLDYVSWMIDEFGPQWLNFAIEVNLFDEPCHAQFPALVTAANATYAAIKAKQASIVAFPSFQIDHLYGVADGSCAGSDQAACFDANYADISTMTRDRFAMSSYAINLGGMTVASLPADWFSRGAARAGEREIIAETGTNSTPVVIDDPNAGCEQLISGDEPTAAAYLSRVLGDAYAQHIEVVNWWSDRDLVVQQVMTDCPCTFDQTWCAVVAAFRGTDPATEDFGELALKAFGTMGLRAYDGTPKSLLATWQAAR